MSAKNSSDWGDLPLRALSAVVLIAIIGYAVIKGGDAFSVVVSAGAVLGGIEAYVMVADRAHACLRYIAFIGLAVLGIGLYGGSKEIILAGIGVCLINRFGFGTLISVLALGAWALMMVRDGLFGLENTLFVIVLAVVSDSCAYFSGRLFGGPRLCPSISPGKTVAGAVGGVLGCMIAALALTAWATGGLSLRALAWGAGISAATQCGDLAESALKRRAGVKDSGRLIPGHGGILDRADGVLGAAIFVVVVNWLTLTWPLSSSISIGGMGH